MIKLSTFGFSLFLSFVFGSGCITRSHSRKEGLNPKYRADIPAQTLIFPCQLWPDHHQKSLSTFAMKATNDDLFATCKEFNAFILNGYKDQPYMRGVSPKLTQLVLAKEPDLKDWQQHWGRVLVDLKLLTISQSPKDYYLQYISHRIDWRNWLNSIKNVSRQSDAILLPFVVKIVDRQYEDRGLPIWVKELGVVSFLVNTTNGDLIWSGYSSASVSTSKLPQESQNLKEPSWEDLYKKVFYKTHWREFPGKRFFLRQ